MHLTTVRLSEVGMPERIPTRPAELRQKGFEEAFDAETLFYDIFSKHDALYFMGPPLHPDLAKSFDQWITVGGQRVAKEDVYIKTSRKMSMIQVRKRGREIGVGDLALEVEDRTDYKRGGRIFYTLQKNNRIEWLTDWIAINNRLHAPDRYVIYDNGSTDYSVHDVAERLGAAFGNVEVHSVPFKYGPGAFAGSGWDSDFLQYAMFEHVRHCFFDDSGFMVNTDIDELVLDRRVFDLFENDAAVVTFRGRWAWVEEPVDPVSYIDHAFSDRLASCPRKWIVDVSRLRREDVLGVHEVSYANSRESEVCYFHFRSINTNWKYNRGARVKFDEHLHAKLSNEQLGILSPVSRRS